MFESEATRRDIERSIHDLKQLMEQSARATLQAQNAAQGKSDFLAAVSREIRAPLDGIMNTIALLLSRDLAAAERNCLETVRSSGEALLALIHNILDASQMAGRRHDIPLDSLLDTPLGTPRNRTAKRDFRILLVDDNPLNQSFAVTMLEELGYQTGVAKNGIEAISNLAHQHYDLVLMDCLMPEMDGFEATRRIRSIAGHAAQVPIVAMAAQASRHRQACLEAGMSDFLAKPVREPELRDKLQHWLSGTGDRLPTPLAT